MLYDDQHIQGIIDRKSHVKRRSEVNTVLLPDYAIDTAETIEDLEAKIYAFREERADTAVARLLDVTASDAKQTREADTL